MLLENIVIGYIKGVKTWQGGVNLNKYKNLDYEIFMMRTTVPHTNKDTLLTLWSILILKYNALYQELLFRFKFFFA